jgi:hypothetical protein
LIVFFLEILVLFSLSKLRFMIKEKGKGIKRRDELKDLKK